MKILVLQLTRLGDIYLTWPVIRALRRQYPQARIDLMVRRKFSGAVQGLDALDGIHVLDTTTLLEPVIRAEPDAEAAIRRMEMFVDKIAAGAYDRVINLSFGPFSASLTRWLETCGATAVGYSRYHDRALRVCDPFSQYFFGQVGAGGANRVHVAKLFAAVSGVELRESDWAPPSMIGAKAVTERILIHIGASEAHKMVSASKWITIISSLRQWWKGEIGILGAAGEAQVAESIMNSAPTGTVENYVGKTTLAQSFRLIADSRLVIGPDSAPMHMAALTRTPCLNLSPASVNYHETGPLAPDSMVLRYENEGDLSVDRVGAVARAMLGSESIEGADLHARLPAFVELLESFGPTVATPVDHAWELTQGLYFGGGAPVNPDPNFRRALEELFRVNETVLGCLQKLEEGRPLEEFKGIIDGADAIFVKIARIVPAVAPLVKKFRAARANIGPAEYAVILKATQLLHLELHEDMAFLIEQCPEVKATQAEVP